MRFRYNAGLTLMVLYGHKATSEDDRFMKLAAESTEVLSNKLVTGGGIWAVDMFPFCVLSFSLWGRTSCFSSSELHSEVPPVLVPRCWVQTIRRRVEETDRGLRQRTL